MVHSGFEATAVIDSFKNPLKVAAVALRGPKTDGPMAPEIPMDKQRPAEWVFSAHVQKAMDRLKHAPKVTTDVATSGDSEDEYAASAE
jgi:hypothetical protein